MNTCQKWAKLGKIPGRPAWNLYRQCHIFDPGQCDTSTMPLSHGLDVGLIEWTERLAQGSKNPQLRARSCPSHQSTSQEDHKSTSVTSVQRKGREKPEGGRPATPRPASLVRACVQPKQGTPTSKSDHRRSGEGGGQMATLLTLTNDHLQAST